MRCCRVQNCHKWVVFGAAVSVAFLDYGLPCTFGALYIGMLDTFNAGRAKTAFVQSLNIAFAFGFGIVSGFFISKWGVKAVSFIGAALTVVGFLMSYFATSIYQLYGFISVISGIGFNAMYVSAVVCVGWTFTGTLKPIVLSVQSVGTAIAGLMWPNLLNASLDTYGLKGTYLIIAGIFLHNIHFAIIFANSSSKQSDAKRTSDGRGSDNRAYDNVLSVRSANDCPNKTAVSYTSTDGLCNCTDGSASGTNVYSYDVIDESNNDGARQNKIDKDSSTNAMQEKTIQTNANVIAIVTQENEPNEAACRIAGTDRHLYCSNKQGRGNDFNSPDIPVIGLTDGRSRHSPGCVAVSDVPDRETSTKVIGRKTHDAFDHAKDNQDMPDKDKTQKVNTQRIVGLDIFIYLTYTLAITIQMSTLAGFVTLYQDINVFSGLTIDQSDSVYMSYSLCNILGRFSPIITAKTKCINSFAVPIIASLCGAVGQLIYLTVSPSLTSVIIAMGFTGLSDGGCMSPMQPIMFEILPMEKQAVGFGFVLTVMGIACALTGPIFGSVRDDTTSYQSVLVTTTTLFLISALLELVCLITTSRCRNNKTTKNESLVKE